MRVLATTGALDPAFSTNGWLTDDFGGGGDGVVLTTLGTTSSVGRALTRDPVGGHLYVAGESSGGGGTVLLSGFFPSVRPSRLGLDSLRRLVTAGSYSSGASDFYVARHWPWGDADTTFGGDGTVTIPFNLGGAEEDPANAVVLQGGRIALAGWAADVDSTKAALVRLEVALIFADGFERGNTGAWPTNAH